MEHVSRVVIFIALLITVSPAYAGSIWEEDFESGLGNWEEMLGEWEIEAEGGNHFLVTPFVQNAQPAGANRTRFLFCL